MSKALTTLSRKNQITIPAQVCRELGLKVGTRLSVDTNGSQIILTPRPASYRKVLGGKLKGVYGTTKEISAYLREERKSWEGLSREGGLSPSATYHRDRAGTGLGRGSLSGLSVE